ncbi:MAG: tRNA lysidine(34) synthetase TilS [Clostridia bacterium]|nr:tRNA lysidine(34) synthetase TilS [Clostridia bacterium]
MKDLISKADSAIDKYSMLEGVSSVAVAFSGGADSTALLHALYQRCLRDGIRLEAIHVDHGIRNESAKRDAEHCRRICDEKGIRLTVVTADVPALAAEWGCGLEEAGRRLRYESFSRICRERGIDRIATAHHAGDNLETVIFNLARGSGLRGLCGIPPVRGNIIRPLIFCSRSDIEGYCRANALEFVTDETNQSDEYTRNYIRHHILPRLEELNPALYESTAKNSALLRQDEEYLNSEAAKHIGDPVSKLGLLPDAILTRTLYLMLPPGVKPGAINVLCAAEAVRQGRETRISVGSATAFVIRRDKAFFTADDRSGKAEPAEFEYILEAEKPTCIPELGITALMTSDPERIIFHADNTQISLNGDSIKGRVYLRPRRPGDKIRVRGMNRTVKNLMQESDIPAEKRRKLPCFCDDLGIIWIPGLPLRDISRGKGTYLVFLEKDDIK